MIMTHQTERLRIALVGTGRMGGEIERLAPAQNIDVAARFDSSIPLPGPSPGDFDVAIDFTRPDALLRNIETMVAWRKPLVIGTTGWLESLDRVKGLVRDHGGRLIYASNFSVGVNIFFRIVREASRLFEGQPSYDVALHEIHHTGKADAPSGTALSIADIILGEIGRKSGILATPPDGKIAPELLHVTSQRLGATVGTHSVSFDSPADTIELVHRAKDRSGFALGALMAARWIAGQGPGIYKFEDLF
jgi:4-hydroxy-tetrahydrodipicolinate reductase